jgi:protein-S-isoprenylcysteine O-methyltransferase Ste14
VYARLAVALTGWCGLTAALLFGAAGTFAWPAGWAFLLLTYGLGLPIGVGLGRHDPGLLRERLGGPFQRSQTAWDKVLLPVILLSFYGWLAFMGLDAVRWRSSHVPLWVHCAGGLGVLCAVWAIYLALRENPFAAPVIKIQRERGQRVITTGPYRIVRHPMYGAAILYFLSIPLLLGSWYGLALAPVLVVLFAVRAVFEERTLLRELEGYRDYMARVHYRFVPLVW